MVEWRGFRFMIRKDKFIYSVELEENKAKELWEQLKTWNGSHWDFYFQFVNPLELVKKF